MVRIGLSGAPYPCVFKLPRESHHIRGPARLTMIRPCLHQLSTPFQNVRATIGTLDLTTDGMPHRLFDDRVRKSRNLLRPCPERCPEAVGGDRPSARGINPLLARDVIHPFNDGEERHVGERLTVSMPREDEFRNPHFRHLTHDFHSPWR